MQLLLFFKEGLDNIFLSFLDKSQQGFNEERSIGTVEMIASIPKSLIIVLLMVIDLLGQNQTWEFIELSRQVLGKDIAACPTVSIVEWMNIFKKIVSSTSLDKVWDRMVVDKTNPLCQHDLNLFLLLRWDIDDFASLVVLDKDRFLPKKLSIELILWRDFSLCQLVINPSDIFKRLDLEKFILKDLLVHSQGGEMFDLFGLVGVLL